MEDYWIKWDDLFIKLHNEKKRKLVFFGRSEDWVPKALRKLKHPSRSKQLKSFLES